MSTVPCTIKLSFRTQRFRIGAFFSPRGAAPWSLSPVFERKKKRNKIAKILEILNNFFQEFF